MRAATTLLAGLVFGFGLCLSGMADPAKVLAFLDVAGAFDPSLAFVMAGAIAVALPGFRWLRGRGRPLFGDRFHWPARQWVDARLAGGAALFGLGWGLSGFCPGPAIVAVPLGAPGALVFAAAMIAGFAVARAALARAGETAPAAEAAE